MKIYTSYWAQVRNFPKNLIGLNTTIFPPRWRPLGQDKRGVIVVDCPPLKPGKECEGLCQGAQICWEMHPERTPDNCAFLQTYYNQLCKLDFNDFMSHLEKLKLQICKNEVLDDVDFALLVYEKWDNLCSERGPIQNWLQKNGIEVEEWHK